MLRASANRAPAVLSEAGAPLSWTSERADTFFVCERVRKAAAHKRQPQRAKRAMHTERAEALCSASDRSKTRERSEHQPQRRAVRRSRRINARDARAALKKGVEHPRG